MDITPAIKYLNIVIPAKAGIQEGTGCRIKSGMEVAVKFIEAFGVLAATRIHLCLNQR